jgi:hypothetical protein
MRSLENEKGRTTSTIEPIGDDSESLKSNEDKEMSMEDT